MPSDINTTDTVNTECLDRLEIAYHTAEVGGVTYLITERTGDGTYAYTAEAISRESARIDGARCGYSYADFCEATSPVTSRELAIALAALEDTRIYDCGGTRILSEDDYLLVRQVAELLT